MFSFFFAKLKAEILKTKNEDERNFNLAVIHKNEGNFFAYRKEIGAMGEQKQISFTRMPLNIINRYPMNI